MGSKQPTRDTFERHHAVVIGASMAGLLAARALSDHFEQVTIIERDLLIRDAEPRKGVPQGRHVHVLLARGAVVMGKYFPDLVVEAGGRGSRAPQWLDSLGYGNVQETSVKIDVGYATRIYRCPAQLPAGWKALLIYGRPPGDKRGGIVFPIQDGYWMVTLQGSLRDYPPDDEAGFLEFARSLAQPDLYEAIKDAEPVTPIAMYKYSADRWRHYERMKRLPEGFIIMGDAVCSFNPVYGQGMSVAAIEAQTLDECLREEKFAGSNSVAGFTQRFQRAIARDIKTPWLLSTGEDLRYPGAEGNRSLSIRLLKPLSTLFRPRIILAVLRRELASFRQQSAVTAPASEVLWQS